MMKINVDRGRTVQILSTCLANLLSIIFGFVLSWTSPAISLLQSDETPLETGPISTEQVSLMTAFMYVGCCLGSMMAGWLSNAVGRRTSLLILVVPQLVGFLLILLAKNVIYLYISRVFSGFSAGSCVCVFPIFVSEICDKSLRGVAGNVLGFGFNFGCLVGKILTAYGGFYATPIAVFVIIGIFIVVFFNFPDTPQYLLLKNRQEDAEKSFKFYRGIPKSELMPPNVEEEFSELKKSPSLTSQNISLSLQDFKGGSTILAILITFFLSCNQNFTGNRILIGYTMPMLQYSGSSMDTAAVDVTITGIQVIVALASIFIVRIIGCRKTLISYYAISCLSFIVAGIHYFLNENSVDMSDLWWLIFISLALSIALTGTGLNALSFSIPAEILPAKIRGSVISSFLIISWILAFLSVQFYFPLGNFWGFSVWMWIFALFCFSGVIFAYFLIPETQGKTYDQVVELLKNKIPKKSKG